MLEIQNFIRAVLIMCLVVHLDASSIFSDNYWSCLNFEVTEISNQLPCISSLTCNGSTAENIPSSLTISKDTEIVNTSLTATELKINYETGSDTSLNAQQLEEGIPSDNPRPQKLSVNCSSRDSDYSIRFAQQNTRELPAEGVDGNGSTEAPGANRLNENSQHQRLSMDFASHDSNGSIRFIEQNTRELPVEGVGGSGSTAESMTSNSAPQELAASAINQNNIEQPGLVDCMQKHRFKLRLMMCSIPLLIIFGITFSISVHDIN